MTADGADAIVVTAPGKRDRRRPWILIGRDVLLAAQPTKRFAEVEELGALAVFLSGDLARSITGTAIPVDGGWTAH